MEENLAPGEQGTCPAAGPAQDSGPVVVQRAPRVVDASELVRVCWPRHRRLQNVSGSASPEYLVPPTWFPNTDCHGPHVCGLYSILSGASKIPVVNC